MFYFEYERLAQKILFTRSERRRVRKMIETSYKPLLKEYFLESFFHEGTICRRRVSVAEYFHNTKNGSDLHVPLSLHAKYTLNPVSLQTPCKSLIQNQSSALPGYPSLFLTIILKWAIDASSARFSKLHITPPHKMTSLYRHSLGTLF